MQPSYFGLCSTHMYIISQFFKWGVWTGGAGSYITISQQLANWRHGCLLSTTDAYCTLHIMGARNCTEHRFFRYSRRVVNSGRVVRCM